MEDMFQIDPSYDYEAHIETVSVSCKTCLPEFDSTRPLEKTREQYAKAFCGYATTLNEATEAAQEHLKKHH